MNRVKRAAAAVCALFGMTAATTAQQIDWTQTMNLPAGLNLPNGVKGDILGIELGEGYASARAKLEAIRDESKLPEDDATIEESSVVFSLPRPGGGAIEASYVGGLLLKLDRPKNPERIELRFSAPSTGQQVIGVRRYIGYDKQNEQPRISELLAGLKAKYRAEPRLYSLPGLELYVFQYDDGRPFNPPGAGLSTCTQQSFVSQGFTPAYVNEVNADGTCDVVLRVEIQPGISEDHVAVAEFWLSDNERTKKNTAADFAFFDDYIARLQQGAGGASPKL